MNFWIGLVSGVFGGMVGMGGGVLMIPLMGRFLKLPQHVCHGTSLVAVVFTGIAGAATYAFFDHVDWTAALLLAAGAFWPVRAGARLCRTMPERNLRQAFGLFLIFASLLLLARPWLFTLTAASARDWIWVAVLLGGGAVTGFLLVLLGAAGAKKSRKPFSRGSSRESSPGRWRAAWWPPFCRSTSSGLSLPPFSS
jgi:uncharacterized membrane protein YfcA